MRADAYTKAVLTIIAVALVWIAAGGPDLVPAAEAQDRTPTRVVIVGWEQGAIGAARALPLPIQVAGWADRTGASHALPQPFTVERARQAGAGLPTETPR